MMKIMFHLHEKDRSHFHGSQILSLPTLTHLRIGYKKEILSCVVSSLIFRSSSMYDVKTYEDNDVIEK